jgi:hypothetical protein
MLGVTALQPLIEEYGRLRRLDGYTAQSRGRRLNGVIAQMLRCWGIEAVESLREPGEIDVGFTVGEVHYVVEAKWEKSKCDTGDIAKLQKRVRQRFAGTIGVFVSMSGYTPPALADVKDGERLEVLLLDANHFEAMLGGLVPPEELLSRVRGRAAFHGEAYTPLMNLLKDDRGAPDLRFDSGSRISVVRNAGPGVIGEVVLRGRDSRQLGVTCRASDVVLVTIDRGIAEADLTARSVRWALPVPGCHRSPLVSQDGAIIFTRRHGVGKFSNGQVEVIAGGFQGNTCLFGHPDGVRGCLTAVMRRVATASSGSASGWGIRGGTSLTAERRRAAACG